MVFLLYQGNGPRFCVLFESAERYAHSRHGKRLLLYERGPPDKKQGDFKIKCRISRHMGSTRRMAILPREWHQVCGQLWELIMWTTGISLSNPTD